MSFRNFILGLIVTFGLPWFLIIVMPFAKMRDVAPVEFDEEKDGITGVYTPDRAGRTSNGSEVYGANGCYVCHSQVIRPTYAGSDVWRSDWAGQEKNADDKDTRRETSVFDYQGEKIAHIGITRNGPDLSNVGYRLEKRATKEGVTVEELIYRRMLNPRGEKGYDWSTCPAQPQLFKKKPSHLQTEEAYDFPVGKNGKVVKMIPGKGARALASYLSSLKKDDQVPHTMNYRTPN